MSDRILLLCYYRPAAITPPSKIIYAKAGNPLPQSPPGICLAFRCLATCGDWKEQANGMIVGAWKVRYLIRGVLIYH